MLALTYTQLSFVKEMVGSCCIAQKVQLGAL